MKRIIFILFIINLMLISFFNHRTLARAPIEKEFGYFEFEDLRKDMVYDQLEARGISDQRLLQAMLKVERHKFVPVNIRKHAYQDGPLPIGAGQTISQPYIVALMTELLELKGNEKVLEVGTGSGYQAAILAELANEVYTIEIIPALAKKAEALLEDLGYTNIYLRQGDGYLGWEEFAPFDAIIVTCAPTSIPINLVDQLKEQGKMVLPLGGRQQELKLIEKIDGQIQIKNIIPVRFVPMVKGRKRLEK